MEKTRGLKAPGANGRLSLAVAAIESRKSSALFVIWAIGEVGGSVMGTGLAKEGPWAPQEGVDLDVIVYVASEPCALKSEVVPPPSFERVRFGRNLC